MEEETNWFENIFLRTKIFAYWMEHKEEELDGLYARIKKLNHDTTPSFSFLNKSIELEKGVVIIGLDSLPLPVTFSKIADILKITLHAKKMTVIVWEDGRSTCVEREYFAPLKKIWLKEFGTRVILQTPQEKIQELLLIELKKIEGFEDRYEKFLLYKKKRDAAVKEQQFGDAAEARDKFQKILEELETIVKEPISQFMASMVEKEIESFDD